MTLVTSKTTGSETDDLIRSFHDSIKKLRTVIEGLTEQVQTGQEVDLAAAVKLIAPAETLIRTCQKVEAHYAETKDRDLGIVRGGYAIDLDAARFEVGCRLARLRTCCRSGEVSE